MKNFIKDHPIIVLLSTVTLCECVVRCTKLVVNKKKKNEEK